ncbi:MAG TPA: GlxA family transcriptional regulator [Acidimicrobiia bacterium]|jgi:transcriptional regulator GlxA family with amidase domain|nr:GlxA family transcriptional regulator [Acidimicrobiia bacterium]
MTRRVVFVIYPGITALDLVGPHEVFTVAAEIARRTGNDADAYAVEVAAPDAGVVRATRGPSLVADRSLGSVRGTIDTVVVVGGEGARAAADIPELVAGLRHVAGRARRITSVCTGAYVLAAAGFLSGRRATTHWAWCDDFARRYPDVAVDPDPIFVRDGNVWTSAGVTAGMDLALALVDEDLGRDVALMTARQLVLFVQRPGGQSQFSAQLGAQLAARQPIRELQHWIVEHPNADLGVDRLAAHVAMSARHFARVFRDEVGCTPAAYVERVRVEVARRLLETTDDAVDEIGDAAGFGTPETLRRAFARRVGTSPSEYRDRFQPSRAS